MKSLPLNALQAFALTVSKGGVRAAARELSVSHSAVSRHLNELERRLGVSLYERNNAPHKFMVTSQGQKLAASVLSALNDVRSAIDALAEQKSRHAVTVSTAPSFAARWLLPRLATLERAYPHLETSILVDQRLDDLRTSEADVAVRMGRGSWPDVRATPLMDDLLYPVMSPDAWKKAGRPSKLVDVCEQRLLHDRDPGASWSLWREKKGPPSLDVRKGARFSSSDLVLRAAAQGLGLALARHRLAADDVDAGLLMRPFAQHSVVVENAYWIVTRPDRAPRPAAETFIAWLRDAARRGNTPKSAEILAR
jgi:LysR family glycine cleavage system transcriptional activator